MATPTKPKPWWCSRTLRFNAAVAGLVALEAGLELLQPVLRERFYVALAVGLPVINAMLRVVTTQALTRRRG